jgi:hypothetical protein
VFSLSLACLKEAPDWKGTRSLFQIKGIEVGALPRPEGTPHGGGDKK